MNEQFTYEGLERLINDVKIARPQERDTLIAPPSSWKYELSLHPERFRIENSELLWLGCKVGTIGSKQEQDEFWDIANQHMIDGIIFKR